MIISSEHFIYSLILLSYILFAVSLITLRCSHPLVSFLHLPPPPLMRHIPYWSCIRTTLICVAG